MHDYHTPSTPCPACGMGLDGASSGLLKGGRPGPGDFSLCAYCGEILRFTADLTLRALAPGDWLAFSANPQLWHILRSAQTLLREQVWRRGGA